MRQQLTNTELRSTFDTLTSLLIKHQPIWKTPVFQIVDYSFLNEYETSVSFLLGLSQEQVDHLQADDTALLAALEKHFPDAGKIAGCINFPAIEYTQKAEPPKFWNTDIPGRKEQQILAFSQALGTIKHPLVEWCCGKQHLGRLLSEVHKQTTIGLDIDPDLIQQARQLAIKRQLHNHVTSECCDVLSEQATHYIDTSKHLIALHACGGLHTHLVQTAANKQAAKLSFSPCCYHRFLNKPVYQALSAAGQNSQLMITQEQLRLAVRETQTAASGETRKRKTLQAWRLGFDLLQRDLLNSDSYLPIPALSPQILHAGFPSFCRQVGSLKGLKLKADTDFDVYLERGWQRFHRYERMELFRMVFRRALECWLVLDKALYLEEQGYACEIRQFCAPEVSPRNLLVQAVRIL